MATPYKPDVPHRTSRSIAIEKNDVSNFTEGPAYDITGGHPVTPSIPSQPYQETKMKPAGEGKPADLTAPFTIKGA
jgi:hypothetical protein